MGRARIETFYDKIGPIYKWLHYNFFFKKCFKTAIDLCHLDENTRVLEVGVGTGHSFQYYPKNCSVTGIDISQAMLKQAQRNIREKKIKNINLKKMNATQIDFPDHSFDYVMAFMVLSATKNPVKVLKEMKRVCKLGGKIVFGNHFLSHNKWISFGEKTFRSFFYWFGFDLALDLEMLIKKAHLHTLKKKTVHKFWTVILVENKKI